MNKKKKKKVEGHEVTNIFGFWMWLLCHTLLKTSLSLIGSENFGFLK